MFVDHRIYTLPHGRMQEYLTRYQAIGWPLQRRYLGHHIGCFVSDIGPLDQVIHMWGFPSMKDREERRTAIEADPEWIAFRQSISGTFSMQETSIWRAASFSPQLKIATGSSRP